jgi:murein DD-endopeptidase MepM/ murein hydrolase activator NlpD
VLAVVLLGPAAAQARTAPAPGAVTKPRSFRMRLPFPCGTWVRVNCHYGKRAHKRTVARHSTNDFHALDLVRAERGNGAHKSVVAVADGVVRYAGWTRGGWRPYGKIVYIEHTYRDRRGYRYQSLYAHLYSVKVRRGQRVAAGEVIGTLGGSSKGQHDRFGAHLHFALYRGAGARLGGGRAVVPEPLGAFEDFRPGMAVQACGAPERQVAFVRAGSRPAIGGLPRYKRTKHRHSRSKRRYSRSKRRYSPAKRRYSPAKRRTSRSKRRTSRSKRRRPRR